MAGLMQSCVSDEPFANGEGEGMLRMKLSVNANLTRAEFDSDSLRSGCVLYISGNEGLLYKYRGIENVPERIPMKSGNYTAEAWTGDSVPASFDKRFFKGFKKFQITQGNESSVVVTCRVANVVVSVNPETIDEEYMKDWKITVSNSSGSLEFNNDNMSYAKGYFMMPNRDIKVSDEGVELRDEEGWPLYTNLTYRIEGKTASGTDFVKEGMIEGIKKNGIVEHAHDYILNIQYNPEYEEQGGAFITVTVNDYEEVVSQEVGLYSRPAIKGVGFEIDNLVKNTEGNFREHIVKVSGFGSLTNVKLSSTDYQTLNLPSNSVDLINIAPAARQELEDSGIKWEVSTNESRNLQTCYISFTEEFLNRIPTRDGEAYAINIFAKDSYGKQFDTNLRLGVGEVEEDAIVFEQAGEGNLMGILSRRAIITGKILVDAVNPTLEYRVKGSASNWNSVKIDMTRAASSEFAVTLNDLSPDTEYEYRGVADDFQSQPMTFRTEKTFVIPNASMENWTSIKSKFSNNNIQNPSAKSEVDFWDTGNHGSSTMQGTLLTEGSTTMKNKGEKSARLNSKFVGLLTFGKLAAGNLFVGAYAGTDGTDGIIDFGREYDGSHPDALKVWVNYRPVAVGSKYAGSHLKAGDLDNGHIYVAFTTEKIHVETKNKSTLFNQEDPRVLAYGDFTFTENYGEEGQLKELTIPLSWKASARTVKPVYIVIVCSASKYGDYFEGGDGSVMYVDDFELVY